MWKEIKKFIDEHPDRSCLIAITAVVLVMFMPSLKFERFIFDDSAYAGQTYLYELSWANLRYIFTSDTVGLYSPLVLLSYIPDYQIWGKEFFIAGCRFQNILWHLAAMMLFYGILRKIRISFKNGDELTIPPLPAVLAVLCAAIHPQRLESVIWIAERKDVMVMTLGLGAVYCFMRAWEKGKTSFAAPLLLLISLTMVKPLMISLPFILTVGAIAAQKKFDFKALLAKVWPLYLAAALYAAGNFAVLSKFAAGAGQAAVAGGDESRLPIAAWNICRYLFTTLFPTRLMPLYPRYASGEVSWLPTVCLLAAAAAVIVSALVGSKKEYFAKTLLAGGLMYGFAVLPVCNLKAIGNVDFADRYSYFPSLFVWLGLTLALVLLLRRYGEYRRQLLLISGVYAGALAVLSWAYLPAWQNRTSQLDAMLDAPKPHPQALQLATMESFELGISSMKRNDRTAMLKHFEDTLRYTSLISREEGEVNEIFCDGINALVKFNLGERDAALLELDRIFAGDKIRLLGNTTNNFTRECVQTIAWGHLRKGASPENIRNAVEIYLMAAQITRKWSLLDSLNYEGVALMIKGDFAGAEKVFAQALIYAPDDENLRLNHANARRKAQEKQPASGAASIPVRR